MSDLISRKILYEKTAEWEAQALEQVKRYDPSLSKEEWLCWSIVLNERTAFKHDVADAPSAEPELIPCNERLPEIKEHHVSDPCIVYCKNGAYGFAELEENIFGQVGWSCEREDDYHEMLGEVVAWMHLPEYNGDEK